MTGPFVYCGLDMFGPFQTKLGESCAKGTCQYSHACRQKLSIKR